MPSQDHRLGEPDDLAAAKRHPESSPLPRLVELLEAADVLETGRRQPGLGDPVFEQPHGAPFDRRERGNVPGLGEANLVVVARHFTSAGGYGPGWREPPEEAVGVPARTRGPVGDRLDHREIEPVEVGGRLEVDRLAEIVGRRVVPLGPPLLHDLVLGRILAEAEFREDGRNSALDEAVLIAPREDVPLRLGVGQHLDAERLGRLAHVVGEVRLLEPRHRDASHRDDRQEHVGVDVRHDAIGWHRRMVGVITRAQQPLFLGRHGEEHQRPSQPGPRVANGDRRFDQTGDSRGVVHRAVVDAVAVHGPRASEGLADAHVIEMRRQHDVLVLQDRIRSRQQSDDVGRFDVLRRHGDRGPQRCRQLERRQRLAGFGTRENVLEGVARSREERFGARRVDRNRQLLPRSLVQRRVGQRQRRLEAREDRALPRNVHVPRIGNRHRADRARFLQVTPANGLVVGEQRSRNPGRTAGQEQDDLAAEVEAREVVVLRFGNAQTVAREDDRRLELRRRIHAHADRGFGAQRDRLGLAAANERETRFVFEYPPRLESDRL